MFLLGVCYDIFLYQTWYKLEKPLFVNSCFCFGGFGARCFTYKAEVELQQEEEQMGVVTIGVLDSLDFTARVCL